MTEYVMVPVPEELVDQVQRHLQWTIEGSRSGPDDAGAVKRLLAYANETERSLLLFVAEETLSGNNHLALEDVAAAIECSDHEALGMTVDLTSQCMRFGGPGYAIMPRRVPNNPSIETPDDPWLIFMSRRMAMLVKQTASRQDDVPK
jgi:hypothetical protein